MPNIMRWARRKLEYIALATGLDDLKVPPGNRFHYKPYELSEGATLAAAAKSPKSGS